MVTLILQANKNKCTWVNEESWETMKNCFPDAKQKNAQIEVWKECIYVQKHGNEIDESFYSPPDNNHTFSASYFQ